MSFPWIARTLHRGSSISFLSLINVAKHRIDLTQRLYKRNIACSRILRGDDVLEELGPPIKPPRKYLDMKTFRKFLKQQKTADIEAEKRAIAEAHAKPPPENWTIADFLKACGITEGVDLIAESFESWNQFISSTLEELFKNTTMTSKQRRIIYKHICLFNHGLWPNNNMLDYIKAFQAPPLENEGKPWDEAADAELLKWAEYYDADFGDVWIYISHKMQRTIEDVQERYIKIYTIPKYKKDTCEFAITKAFKPLLMNRSFKMDPPYLYIIPSEENFKITPIYKEFGDKNPVKEPHEVFSSEFLKYRRPECFK